MKYTHRLLSLPQPAARQYANLHPMLGQGVWSDALIDRLIDDIRRLAALHDALEQSTESVRMIDLDDPLPWEERDEDLYGDGGPDYDWIGPNGTTP